ncbi:MAG TPA: LytTR family DNA-binding domain-containing protein [Mucilaginibacter sp.]|jgi:DNA-binding LytR/AlgR family response regulator|nr:LytTR family DNA-binding domain-containing protein [Mucilaginibacter sp.]
MKKLSCIIVDDEPVARKILHEFVDQVPFLDLHGKFENAMKAEAFLKVSTVDLIFLDIEMPKISGLQFLQKLNIESMVVLTTAFPQYALEGYELDIIDYLLKPFALSRFLKAVQKAKDFYEMKHKTVSGPLSSYIFIKSDKRIEKIELSEILYAESVGNYVSVYTDDKRILAYLTMKSLEAQLPADDFIKIHQSYLVNCSKIDAIEGNEVKLGCKSLPISRNFRDLVMKVVNQRLLRR